MGDGTNPMDKLHEAGVLPSTDYVPKDSITTTDIQAGAVGTTDLADDSVTNDKIANIAAGSVKCGGVANAPTDVSIVAAGTILIGQGAAAAPAGFTVSGDAGLSAGGALTIVADAVDNNKLANIAAGSVKCGGVAAAPTDVDIAAAGTILIGQGAAAAPAGFVVSGDAGMTAGGVLTVVADAIDNNKLANMVAGTVKCGGVANAPTDVDCSVSGAVVFGQGAGAAPVAHVIAGDVNVDNAGASVIQALSVDTGMISAGAVTAPKVGRGAIIVADTAVAVPGVECCFVVDYTEGVTGGHSLTIPAGTSFLVTDAEVIKLTADCGASANLVEVRNGADVITNILDLQTAGPAGIPLPDRIRVPFVEINDLYTLVVGGTALTVYVTHIGNSSDVRVVIRGIYTV